MDSPEIGDKYKYVKDGEEWEVVDIPNKHSVMVEKYPDGTDRKRVQTSVLNTDYTRMEE